MGEAVVQRFMAGSTGVAGAGRCRTAGQQGRNEVAPSSCGCWCGFCRAGIAAGSELKESWLCCPAVTCILRTTRPSLYHNLPCQCIDRCFPVPLPPLPAEAKKPDDWDDEEDGDWEPPKVANPKCKEAPGCGEWKRPEKAVRHSRAGAWPTGGAGGEAGGMRCMA